MVGWAPKLSASRRATISVVRSRSGSMSCRLMVASANSGKLSRSPSRFFAKTVLPAPIKVILGMEISSVNNEYQRVDRGCAILKIVSGEG